ncbi:YciI family protein [Hydrogenovibrio sp. 3SP14C1]|uniref:YciI family protein n=1 Tax=Hydrogenovibrio sp. 3SP14C1 TaxID=3038774 RepID=UPI002416F6EF|nr:YciI family protein [Hydrogenovibrio sp. 3SP14C1]MDG4812794.1 YciI family protein [Hydrogenovibrio sp. 3SP14C1]
MLYSIFAYDVEDSLPLRAKARPGHIARLNEMAEAGRLILAGPNPAIDSNDPGEAGFSGSLIVAEFDSLEEAQAWANADPYLAAGVYEKVEVKPFKKVLP